MFEGELQGEYGYSDEGDNFDRGISLWKSLSSGWTSVEFY